MNICIINQHTLNYGDEIAGTSLIDQLFSLAKKEEKEIKIHVLYNSSERLQYTKKNLYHREDIKLSNMGVMSIFFVLFLGFIGIEYQPNKFVKEFNETIKKSDYIVVAPGGANIGIYKDWRYLVRLLMVVNLKRRLIFHNNTIGKSNSFIFNLFSRYILKRSDLYVREKKSLELMNSMHFSATRTVDTGFLFNNTEKFNTDLEDYFVFVPTRIENWHPNFKGFDVDNIINSIVLPSFVQLSKQNQKKIVILPHLNGDLSEKELLEHYKERITSLDFDSKDVIIPTLSSCYEYDNFIKNSDFVLSMRYHGVIMAIKNKVKFFSLSYENKMKEACNYSGFPDNNLNLKRIDNESIKFMHKCYYSTPNSKEWERSIEELIKEASLCTNQIFFREK
ncbi:polysaccharide pyruvyl transferase family protein [Enterococcus sp. AZ007]|uniref:polysaccharide pyruvyl transferase family protein n=1 Tax=Enterococcus sp. AZ007 TaxID=2774839 RepID=UPI003F283453